ncbi:glycosyltransferase family 4 protein [Salipiger mangrovisoli]|uniref:Glycosyltransferase family 4 protein n=1 Tax=Salipiger mangrovisoli TaxID=2865933 RepID=A0ABR9WXN4_9RHOB|nr:glycosyltransferase family 4 protein [Salipiger mangrovisoli]MBE9636048.1 glycosyltransferase family 4 protein [Salipiger mangrovisoli]
MARRPLKIAYLSDFPAQDRNLYSGGNARMHDALRAHAGEVTVLPIDWGLAEPLRRTILALPDALSLRLRWRAQMALAPVISRRIASALRKDRYDVLFGAYAFQSLLGLRLPYPMTVAYTSDATHSIYRRSEIGQAHPGVIPGGRLLDDWVERSEAEVFRRADLLLWPSQWLMDASAARYDIPAGKAQMVPWGANIAPPPPPAPRPISRSGPLHLLVVGRNWWAKGGRVAQEVMCLLRARGIDARLTVIGCLPPPQSRGPHIEIHPQLDKSVPEQAALFQQLYARSHFVVMPSFESYGFAFCEASAHGVPSLCLRIGGVPVRDGINGYAMPPGCGAEAFVTRILECIDNPERYATLSRSSREEYETRLNWDAWGQAVGALLEAHVAQRSEVRSPATAPDAPRRVSAAH